MTSNIKKLLAYTPKFNNIITMIKLTCVVCKKVYKEVPDEQNGISHGCCQLCYHIEEARVKNEVAELKRNRNKPLPTIEVKLTQMKIGEIKNIKDIILERKDNNLWVLTPWVKDQTGYPLEEVISKLVQ